ncbi:MAG: hypothetical protein ABJA66_18375 [Actinomycetota bacterium]
MNERLNRQLDCLSGFVLTAFPVALLIDDLLPSGQASPMQFMVSLSAAWFFGASIIALARMAWIYRPRAVIVACAFALAGIFGSVAIMVFRFVTETIRQTEGAIGNAAQFNLAIGKTTPFIFMPGLIPPLVLFFLAAMLFRFQNKSRWAFALACVGILLFPAGRIFLGQTVVLLSDALLLISLGWLGWQTLSGKQNLKSAALTSNSPLNV